MKKLTTCKRAGALLLCALFLCVPMLGMAAPSAEAGTMSDAVSGNETPEESPAPEAPACSCDVKCTATTPNVDCPVCAADVAGCTGKETEDEE